MNALPSFPLPAHSRLVLDYSVFGVPKLAGRATGKIEDAREPRMTDREVEEVRTLVQQVRSCSSLAFPRTRNVYKEASRGDSVVFVAESGDFRRVSPALSTRMAGRVGRERRT